MSADGEGEPDAGDLEEAAPGPVRALWRPVAALQAFREAHGDRYTTALEAITAAVLVGGYLYWAFLFLTQ